jgi:predicted patatin/cPLA2 family phospholipase
MEKFGLVLEGGGVRGAYTAGALAWLQDNDIYLDYNVGISSGAVYLCNYLMHEKEVAYNMCVEYATDPRTVGIRALFKEGYYVAYRRIFVECLAGLEHMSMKPLVEQHMPVEVGAYHLENGRTEFFGPDQMDADDKDLVLLNGTCALPLVSKVVVYKGMHLLDGGITKMIPIERAKEQGCTKFLVITTKPADFVRKPSSKMVLLISKMMYHDYPQVSKDYAVRQDNYYRQIGMVNDEVKNGNAINIFPSETINVNRFKGDKPNAQRLYDLGYHDMETHKEEIFAFVKK